MVTRSYRAGVKCSVGLHYTLCK